MIRVLVTSSLLAFVFNEDTSGKNEPLEKKCNLKKHFLMVELRMLKLGQAFLGMRAFSF